MKQFNFVFIFKGDGTFTPEDYQKAAKAEQIRNISDYDDFYIATREEAEEQIETAKELLRQIETYVQGRL